MIGIDKAPMQEEFEEAQRGGTDLDKKVIKVGELNKLANEDLILSIKTISTVRKVAFRFLEEC